MPSLVNMFWRGYRFTRPLMPNALRKPFGRLLRRHLTVARENSLAGYLNPETGEIHPGFAITSSDTVVDVGCGPGDTALFAASRGAEVIAVDIDPLAVKSVKDRLARAGTARRFEVHLADAHPLPIASGRATKVIAEEVMEHVDDPRVFLRELYRIGKPGASYLIAVPDPASETVMKPFVPKECWEKPYHIHVYERPEFAGLVRDAGFEIVSHELGGFYSSMWWFLMWGSQIQGDVVFGSGQSKALHHWNMTWAALLETPQGRKVRESLDQAIPKSQRIIARKPA